MSPHYKHHDLISEDHSDVNSPAPNTGDVLVWTPDLLFLLGVDPNLTEVDLPLHGDAYDQGNPITPISYRDVVLPTAISTATGVPPYDDDETFSGAIDGSVRNTAIIEPDPPISQGGWMASPQTGSSGGGGTGSRAFSYFMGS